MTTVTFLTEDARIIGFDVQGHSGWGESGEDIVCAAITSAVRLDHVGDEGWSCVLERLYASQLV